MSHEIRTPINAVLGFDEMILRESREEEVLSYAKNIKTSGQSLLNLVNDILDLSKIEAGKMEIVNAEYDVVGRLSELLKMIGQRASEKGLKLSCDIDPNIPRKLFGDEVRIAQVLTNLLTNAVKYTKEGEVLLQVELEEMNEKGVDLYFAVKDTGIGIREEDKEKLFSEFSRVEGESTHRIEGPGLGLPISMKCLMLMGSKLEVESKVGEGSTFYFRLHQDIADKTPIGDFQEAWREVKEEVTVFHEDFTAPRAHILVVDDVDLNLKVFKGLLKNTQMQIDTATNGFQAIDMIEAQRYDCVFMDHQMPEMDGIETMERLKKDPKAKLEGVPMIALTANAIAGARETYLQKGFSDYLSKPIDGWKLLSLLHKWLPAEKIKETAQVTEEVMEFLPEGMEKTETEDERTSAALILRKLCDLGIDVVEGLKYAMNEEDFYLELLRDYVSNSKEIRQDLARDFAQKDWKNYQIKVHALKSSSKMIGAMDLSEAAKDMEYAARDGKEDILVKEQEGFLEKFDQLISDLSSSLA
ncbi:MAG: response regulator [Lachnospiraceae bacterium]|nr:response regulator [Lachnospiraceae bacterium]